MRQAHPTPARPALLPALRAPVLRPPARSAALVRLLTPQLRLAPLMRPQQLKVPWPRALQRPMPLALRLAHSRRLVSVRGVLTQLTPKVRLRQPLLPPPKQLPQLSLPKRLVPVSPRLPPALGSVA